VSQFADWRHFHLAEEEITGARINGNAMSHYFIDNHAADGGSHEVHALGCKRMPTDKRYLGNFYQVGEALMEARKEFWQSNGCDACAREPHIEVRPMREAVFIR
jgi:hypothetical protein